MKLLHLIPLCGAAALFAACDPKPSTPSMPGPPPIAEPTPTPDATITPMPNPTAEPITPAPAGTPDLGSGPMTTPQTENSTDKSLIAPPTSVPGSGNTSSDPSTR